MMTHEALGHGGYCLAAGGHSVMLTAWWETCHFPKRAYTWNKGGKPHRAIRGWSIDQAGAPSPASKGDKIPLLLVAVHGVRPVHRLGYVAFSDITDLGDGAELIAGLHLSSAWRGVLVLLGAVVYFCPCWRAPWNSSGFAGSDNGINRLFRLVWNPSVTAGIFACCTGALTQMLGVTGLAVAAQPWIRRWDTARRSDWR